MSVAVCRWLQATRASHLDRVFFALMLVRSDRILSLPSPALCSFVREMVEFAALHLPIREVSDENARAHRRQAELPWKLPGEITRTSILAEVANNSLDQLTIAQIGLPLAIRDY